MKIYSASWIDKDHCRRTAYTTNEKKVNALKKMNNCYDYLTINVYDTDEFPIFSKDTNFEDPIWECMGYYDDEPYAEFCTEFIDQEFLSHLNEIEVAYPEEGEYYWSKFKCYIQAKDKATALKMFTDNLAIYFVMNGFDKAKEIGDAEDAAEEAAWEAEEAAKLAKS